MSVFFDFCSWTGEGEVLGNSAEEERGGAGSFTGRCQTGCLWT